MLEVFKLNSVFFFNRKFFESPSIKLGNRRVEQVFETNTQDLGECCVGFVHLIYPNTIVLQRPFSGQRYMFSEVPFGRNARVRTTCLESNTLWKTFFWSQGRDEKELL